MATTSKQSKKISLRSKKKFLTYAGGVKLHSIQTKKKKLKLYDDIMKLLSRGHYRQEIADLLGLSKQRIYYLCRKLEKAGFIERTGRTSIIQYRVYYDAWRKHLKELKVKKSDWGDGAVSIHNDKFRFPVRVPGGRRIKRIQYTTPDGVGIDVNNQSIIVWVPRMLFDLPRHKKYPGKEGWDGYIQAFLRAYQVAFVVASRIGVEIIESKIETIPPYHFAKEFFMDFSKGVMEMEATIFGKTKPDFLPRRRLDYYL